VIEGNKLGHNLGFPTINIEPSVSLPLRNGVFACRLDLDGMFYNGVANIGIKPTFGGEQLKAEMNIFDFNQDIYGRFVKIYPQVFIRDEVKFNSVDDLKNQIKKDAEDARTFFE
jgi:riboflavin kinase/FMN adenylyltransferase